MIDNKKKKQHTMSMPDGLEGLLRTVQEGNAKPANNAPAENEQKEEPKETQQPTQKSADNIQSLMTPKAGSVRFADPQSEAVIQASALLYPGVQAFSPYGNPSRPVPVPRLVADNSWDLFRGYMELYKRDTSKGKEIWINEDIRYELDKIKTASRSSMRLKTMVNAMLRTFLDLHHDEIEELLKHA